ncbi:zinc finger protein 436-like isoform X2 [Diorhabda sublineata]|uniref:zinc finger protein 436-like isoform X2 n=1 Tax=Diorhabda sublineata TaxID=1163346 RepID=UPI0024E0935D|nr:zinc finger protein 436-like isoform X2 [Diorhabda sublineata]
MSSNGEACIICNVAWVPDTDYIEIFGADSNRESDLHVASLVFKLLDKEIKEEPNGPQLICKKCFSLISELDELHTRVTEIKSEIFDSNKIKEENDSQETQSECGTENFPQKMLFIPSSDEDSTQVSTEKNCFENIQLEFVKMHGIDLETGIEQPRENTDMEIDTNIEYQQFSADEGEILDAGAMENSSDSDYEPSNISSSLIQSSLMGVDKGVRPYICEVCGKDFASKYTYKAHEKTHEFRPRPYKCSQCDKSFLSQQNLTQHERTHLGMKEYACQLCGKQFGSSHNLEVHSIVHTGYKPFVCGLCGKAFARKAEIRDHERTHTGERPYQCEFCGATFSQRSNLQSHKRATHYDDKRYQCTICSKGFKRRRLLDYHIKAAHTGERPFKCEICEATFVYPEHFKKHRRIHTGEKPFLCEVCGKAFNSRDNRNAHRFIHSDKKPYECLVCGAGFMRKPLLYQHMQNQGHLNDTIVVNQPRLTTEDDQLVTVNSAGEMEILDTATDGKLYIQDQDGTEHIIIDGQQISFAEVGSEGDNEEAIEQIEHVIADQTDDDCEEIISSDALASGETQIIETPDGPIQLVKVRIPNENGEEEEAWIKIVPE